MNERREADWQAMSRRQLLWSSACGFGGMAWSALASGSEAGLADVGPHRPPRAKRVIFLFMQGGVSQVDSFDYKPQLARHDGQEISFDDARKKAKTGAGDSRQRVMNSPWKFRRHGQSGRWVSGLFPQVARHVDRLTFLHGVHTEGVAHGPATLFLHCGATNLVRPSVGSWVQFGLGSENEDLPGFVSLCPSAGNGGARNYGNAFLPSYCQGVAWGRAGESMESVRPRNIANLQPTAQQQRTWVDRLERLNRVQQQPFADDSDLEAAIRAYEMAWRMQRSVPRVMDFAEESRSTLDRYGIGSAATDAFGRQCLLARRLCEAGVRFVQVTYGDNSANPAWDQHSDLPKHAFHARAVDQPIAALLDDLHQRGLLEDTIVWWGGEFGRTPYAQDNGTGRDHNPGGFTVWMAGGGFRPGVAHGETDEWGHRAVQGRVHMHDLHATLLHQLGIDHERLTYRHAGRDFRLTDVHGTVVREVVD